MMINKKNLAVFISIIICFLVYSSSVFAELVTTSYSPWNLVTNEADQFAKQRDNYPWCMITCAKIVLRDIYEKNIVNNHTISANIKDLLKPNSSFNNNRWDIEEEIVRKLFIEHNTTGYGAYNPNGLDDNFTENATTCTAFKNASYIRQLEFFKALVGMLPQKRLENLWKDLGDLKKYVVPASHAFVCDEIKNISSISNYKYTVISPNNDSAINQHFKGILNEIKNKKMVILCFEDPNNAAVGHACVAYAGECFGGNDVVSDNVSEEEKAEEYISVYNPCGNKLELNNVGHNYIWGNNVYDVGRDCMYRLIGYYTFDY